MIDTWQIFYSSQEGQGGGDAPRSSQKALTFHHIVDSYQEIKKAEFCFF